MDKMVYYCTNCGNKQEFEINWPIDMHSIKITDTEGEG